MGYGYYDYLENYYEAYYDYYYEYTYWPAYYANTSYNGTYPPSQYQYIPAYQMEYITPPLFTTSVLCAVLSLVIGVLICYKLWQGKNKKKEKVGTNKITVGLTLFCALMHLAQNMIDPVTYYTWFIEYDPHINKQLYIVYDVFWCLAKLSLYFLFIYRYYLIYDASVMMIGARKMQKYFIFGCFVVTMMAQCSLYLVYMLLRHELIEYEKDTEYGKRIWLNVCWAFLVMDVLLIAVLGYLLSHSLLKLIVNINTLGGTRKGVNKIRITLPSNTNVTSNNKSFQSNATSATSPTDLSSNNTTKESSKPTKIECQLSEYITDHDNDNDKSIASNIKMDTLQMQPTSPTSPTDEQKTNDEIDKEDMRLFLMDYDLNDNDILNKINKGHIKVQHLIGIDENDLNELCQSLGLDTMQKIRFKSAVKELNKYYSEDVMSVDSMGSRSGSMTGSKYKSRKDRKKKKKYKSKKGEKLNDLMHTTTRIALTMIVSMISSFIYQLFWLLAYELQDWDMLWMAYTWCIDAVVNILCVYLSMGVATDHYKILCHDCCKLHQCTLKCIQKVVPDSKN